MKNTMIKMILYKSLLVITSDDAPCPATPRDACKNIVTTPSPINIKKSMAGASLCPPPVVLGPYFPFIEWFYT